MIAEDHEHRHLHALAAGRAPLEDRRLGNRQPHVQTDEHEHRAGEKRDAASRTRRTDRRSSSVESSRKTPPEKKKPDRRAKLREHAVPARACLAARFRSRAGPPRPIRRRGRAPGQSGRARAAPAPRGRSSRRSAAARSPPSTGPSSAARRRASSCGRSRSPKWPKSAEPIGRATNAMPNVASDASVADAGSDGRKEQLREHEDSRGRVDVEVEELDGRADEAGEQHLAGPVDRYDASRAFASFTSTVYSGSTS